MGLLLASLEAQAFTRLPLQPSSPGTSVSFICVLFSGLVYPWRPFYEKKASDETLYYVNSGNYRSERT